MTRVLEDSFVYSCTFDQQHGHEQFVPHHVLAFQFSGETHIRHQAGKLVLKKDRMLLAQRDQLARSRKIPAADGPYKIISVLITATVLQQYALTNPIDRNKHYTGEKNILLKPDTLLKDYFRSLLPYAERSGTIGKRLAAIKTNEAIELLLHLRPSLGSFLFDLREPHKIDLEGFMLRNFHYNVPMEHFAKLTGRSLAAFKRDFDHIFHTSPRKWLQERRLVEAYRLIQQKGRRPAEIYLEIGFENLSHFYTSFKQRFGTTPANIQRST